MSKVIFADIVEGFSSLFLLDLSSSSFLSIFDLDGITLSLFDLYTIYYDEDKNNITLFLNRQD